MTAVVMAFLALFMNLGAPLINRSDAALSTCDEGERKGFIGASGVAAPSTAVYGARAQIEHDNPALCSSYKGSPSASSAWVMVATRDGDYAQAGYMKVGAISDAYPVHAGDTWAFAQWTKACNPLCEKDSQYEMRWGADTGGTRMYKVFLRAADHHIYFYAGDDYLGQTAYDAADAWPAAWIPEYAGEVKHVQSDIPGTAGDHTLFNYLQYYTSTGDLNFTTGIQEVVKSGVTTDSRFHVNTFDASVGGTGMNVWTAPLQ